MTRARPPSTPRSGRPRKPKVVKLGVENPPIETETPPPAAPVVPDPQQFAHSAEGFWKAAGRFGRLR